MPAKGILPPEFATWATAHLQRYVEAQKDGSGRSCMKQILSEFEGLPFADPSYSAYQNPDGTSKIKPHNQLSPAQTLRLRAGEWFRNHIKADDKRLRHETAVTTAPRKTRGAKATQLYVDSLGDEDKNAIQEETDARLAMKFVDSAERASHRLAVRAEVIRDVFNKLSSEQQESWNEKARKAQAENREALGSPATLARTQAAFISELQEFLEKRVPKLGTCGVWVHGIYMNEETSGPTKFSMGMESRGKPWFADANYKTQVQPAWDAFAPSWCLREHQRKIVAKRGTVRKAADKAEGGCTPSEEASSGEDATPEVLDDDEIPRSPHKRRVNNRIIHDSDDEACAPGPGQTSGPSSSTLGDEDQDGVVSKDDDEHTDEEDQDGVVSKDDDEHTDEEDQDGVVSKDDDELMDDDELDGLCMQRSRTQSPTNDMEQNGASSTNSTPQRLENRSSLPSAPTPSRTGRRGRAVQREQSHGKASEQPGQSADLGSPESPQSPNHVAPRLGRKRNAEQLAVSSRERRLDNDPQPIVTAPGVAETPSHQTKRRKVQENTDATQHVRGRAKKPSLSRELKALGEGQPKGRHRKATAQSTGPVRQTRRSSGSGALVISRKSLRNAASRPAI